MGINIRTRLDFSIYKDGNIYLGIIRVDNDTVTFVPSGEPLSFSEMTMIQDYMDHKLDKKRAGLLEDI